MSGAPDSEVARQADFSLIRYALCWEDADILLEALDIRPSDECLSIASAGDNTLSLLSQGPRRVVALDLSPAQMACLELRVAAYRTLDHADLLALFGETEVANRLGLFDRLRPQLSEQSRAVWDRNRAQIARGIGAAGRFERYITIFRRCVLPLIHTRRVVEAVFEPRSKEARRQFYRDNWDNWRWRVLTRLFTSRRISAWLGRDPSFFRYVEGGVADRTLCRAKFALTELDPSKNPYLHWIAFGHYGARLPHALRPENFDAIRHNLDRLEMRVTSLEAYLAGAPDGTVDKFNLSDIFEYVSQSNANGIYEQLARVGRNHGRLAYWNTFVPRCRPQTLAAQLCPLDDLATRLYLNDKAFFYGAFVTEEILQSTGNHYRNDHKSAR